MDMIEMCNAAGKFDAYSMELTSYCSGYLIGFTDANTTCVPVTVSATQLTAVFLAYARQHPQGEARTTVFAAFREAFPCR